MEFTRWLCGVRRSRILAFMLLQVTVGTIVKHIYDFGSLFASIIWTVSGVRKSVFKQGNDEPEVREHVENCCRTPLHHGERTLAEPGIRFWTPSND